ncbi:aldo/keto reductase [Campylobacter jejuni]|uniref:aldo/keto reductase n=3 Tax=Campylobacter jejuni TaxID=197 RepID=UPI000A402A3E|nr:aldo/keto reductase [Campylobacter jejuni]
MEYFKSILKKPQACVEDALSVGYRLIDTASIYNNEEAVGSAIKASGIKREELFITTKLWVDKTNEKLAKKAFEESLKKLGLDYIDLYLIHQPFNDTYGAWRVMSEIYKEGLSKAIGVSNFYPDRLVDFCLHNEIKPMLNQVECHPFHQQNSAQNTMNKLGIIMQAWASFAEGHNNLFNNITLQQIGAKHGKSVAQVVLRWLIEREIAVIPKTLSKDRMKQNFNVFDFSLDTQDKEKIASLASNAYQISNHHDTERVSFLSRLNKY